MLISNGRPAEGKPAFRLPPSAFRILRITVYAVAVYRGNASEELVRRAKNSLFGSSPRPTKQLAVVTCMDGRIDPMRILAMSLGDIHVIRNAGGLVTEDVLRSLVVSQRMLGTREVLIFMHTDCGLYGLDDRAERAAAEAEMGQRIPFEFGAFDDLEARTRASVLAAQICRYLPHRDRISGGIYDVNGAVLHRLH